MKYGATYVAAALVAGGGLAAAVQYPKNVAQRENVEDLTSLIDHLDIWYDVQTFTKFTNRCFEPSYTSYGLQARSWLLQSLEQVMSQATKGEATIKSTGDYDDQQTVVVTITGRSNKTIVVGAHYDACASDYKRDLWGSSTNAPGADDNASGSMTNLEALRVLMRNETITNGEAPHTIEFHWYASMNGPLNGSAALFNDYATCQTRDVVAMLNQDRTGYTGDVPDGEIPALGVVEDFTDRSLTEFLALVIKEYTSNPFRYVLCGGECSDHVSATDNGFPSAYVRASPEGRNRYVGTPLDRIGTLNLGHMVEHVKLVVGFVTELAFAELG